MAVSLEKSQLARLPWLTALLTVTCISLAVVFHIRWTRPVDQWPINLPPRRYTFTDHPALRDFDDGASNRRWADMVWHDWWDTMWRDDNGREFKRGIDLFHKMHCLVAIREEFVGLVTKDTRTGHHMDEEEKGEKTHLVLNQDHLEHCFDFLRQDILCKADMALEPLSPEYMETDGQGVEHDCLDWRILLDHVGLKDGDEL